MTKAAGQVCGQVGPPVVVEKQVGDIAALRCPGRSRASASGPRLSAGAKGASGPWPRDMGSGRRPDGAHEETEPPVGTRVDVPRSPGEGPSPTACRVRRPEGLGEEACHL